MVTLGDFRVTWKHFGVTRGSLWSILEPLGCTLGSLKGSLGGHFGPLWDTLGSLWCYFWVYECCSGVIFFHFQKILIFLMNLNDFIYLLAQLAATGGAFWGDFGALWNSRRMAGLMPIGAGLVGLKSENVHGTRATGELR